MDRKIVSVVAGVIVGALLLLLPSAAQAEINPANTRVFTGRFIPAFIGTAYDPQVAFEDLAGLPVYVFTYDRWDGPAKTGQTTWVYGDIAVRTQIRSDGTFQVMGLPPTGVYAVYFPFSLGAGPSGEVVRTDCLIEGGPPADVGNRDQFTNDGTTQVKNPCKASQASITKNFRMPRPEDGISDVFSYTAAYLTKEVDGDIMPNTLGPIKVNSQIITGYTGTTAEFEELRVEHAFLTHESRLDVENNINTFPLVPNRTLKIKTTLNEGSGAQFEVWAIRYARSIGNAISGKIDYPVVSGRSQLISSDPTLSDYLFQAYAPEGFYAVIVWRKEENSPAYNEWDGVDSLNTQRSALAQIWVNENTTLAQSSDWRTMTEMTATTPGHHQIVPGDDSVIVWGIVTNDKGDIVDSKSALTGIDATISLASSTRTLYYGYPTGVSSTSTFVPVTLNATPVDQIPNSPSSIAIRGMYGYRSFGYSGPFSDELSINVHPDTTDYRKALVTTRMISSYMGPRRYDIPTGVSRTGSGNGYSDGILINSVLPNLDDVPNALSATDIGVLPNLTAGPPAAGAAVTIKILGLDETVPAEGKVYTLNNIGEVHIPASDLVPRVNDDYDGYKALVTIKLDQFYDLQVVTLSATNVVPVTGNMKKVAAVERPPTYNLAILNTAERLLTPEKVLAADLDPVYITAALRLPTGTLESNGATVIVKRKRLDLTYTKCYDCYLEDLQGNPINMNSQIQDGSFAVFVPVPVLNSVLNGLCLTDAAIAGLFNQDSECRQSIVDDATSNFRLEAMIVVNGEVQQSYADFSVGVDGRPSVGEVNLDFTYDCNAHAKTVCGIGPSMCRFVTNISCHGVNFFNQNLPSVLGAINKYGLQTRALSQDRAILELYEIVRNVVNVLFVIIFVLIGIMTILRYQPEQWHLSVLLPRLLLALFFANFGIIIVQAILDLNNFLTNTMFQFTLNTILSFTASDGRQFASYTGAGAAAGVAIITSLSSAAASMASGLIAFLVGTGGTGGVAVVIFVICFIVVLFGQFLMLLALLLLRYALIWIVTIATPLVFAISVLPWFSKYRDQWWSMLISVAFVQTAVAGVLSIGIMLMLIGADENTFFFGFGTTIIGMVVVFMAIKLPKQMLQGAAMIGGVGAAAGAVGARFSKSAEVNNFKTGQEIAEKQFNEGRDLSSSEKKAIGRSRTLKTTGSTLFAATTGFGARGGSDLLGDANEAAVAAQKKGAKKAQTTYAKATGLSRSTPALASLATYADPNTTLKDASGGDRDKSYFHLPGSGAATIGDFTGDGTSSPAQVVNKLGEAAKRIKAQEKDDAIAKKKIKEMEAAIKRAGKTFDTGE